MIWILFTIYIIGFIFFLGFWWSIDWEESRKRYSNMRPEIAGFRRGMMLVYFAVLWPFSLCVLITEEIDQTSSRRRK